MSVTKEELRYALVECKEVRSIAAGSTNADFQFRKRVNMVMDLLLDWMEYQLDNEIKRRR